MKTIAITNQKGGVGKTTTALATAQGLALEGKKVLAVDLDPQANTSLVLGVRNASPNVLDVLLGQADVTAAIYAAGSVHAIAADRYASNIADAIREAHPGENALEALKDALEAVSGFYDYCIIDTPSEIGTLTLSALTAADYVVIPVEADVFSLTGCEDVLTTLETVREQLNPSLKIAGVLLTKAKKRTILNRDIRAQFEQVARDMGTELFESTISDSVKTAEAAVMRKSIFEYSPRSTVAKDYWAYILELRERVEK